MKEEKPKAYEKKLIIPVKRSMWKALKTISFETEISMSDLTRTALEKLINKHKKDIDETK